MTALARRLAERFRAVHPVTVAREAPLWVMADAEALPYDAASFDVVLSTFGVMFAPDQAKAASEMARVCRPGGRIGGGPGSLRGTPLARTGAPTWDGAATG